MYSFEWDPDKSRANKRKHGVTFREALEIWRGLHLTVENLAKSMDGESRSATIGVIGADIYIAFWNWRKRVIRLISVRRARDGEKKAFRKNL